jgi:hypothetical protein
MKKQNGGVIDNPANCNNDETPIYFDEINEETDIIYVGDKLEGDKYNCYKPEELKEIIKIAIKNRTYPQDQLTRKNLSEDLINRIVAMYPEEFVNIIDIDEEEEEEEEEEDVTMNVTPTDMVPILLEQFRITTPADRHRHETRIKTLKEALKKYDTPNDPPNNRWNQWYNNPAIPMNYKDAMINLFKLFGDGFGIRYMKDFSLKLLSTDLIELINYPAVYGISSDKNFRFHYYKDDENILAIAITYVLNIDESIERLNRLGIEDTDGWTVYKLATIATVDYYGKDDTRTDTSLAEEFISDIIGFENNNKLLLLGYDFVYSLDDEEFTYYVTDILDFYNVEGVSEDYYELYSTYDENNESLYISKSEMPVEQDGGFKKKKSKKIVYKRRSSKKKKSSKRKSSKRKSSKRKSSKRKSSKQYRK